MKIVSKIYRKTVLAATLAVGVLGSSCTDYLTIIPADVVVEENFWQTKDQVNGMLATSYLKLLSSDAVSKAIIWGEMRSDNMTYPPSYSTDIKNIVEANIIDENNYCRWGIFYEAINYANLVLESAPQVIERDPDFSEGDLDVVMGEMYAMRALCHFYLVRTFRDIPLAMKSARNDSEIPDYVQVHPLEALNAIMDDLNRAENMVMKSGAFSSDQQNYGRITRNAVLAMKADVNLWRAAFATYYENDEKYVKPGDVQMYYDECVQNCNDVITNMDNALEEENKGKPVEKYAYNLIQNRGDVKEKENGHFSTAYDDIFGTKNSSESIFELQVQGSNTTNGFAKGVYSVYGTEGNPGLAIVPQGFVTSNYEEDDLRAYSFTNLKSFKQTSTDNQSTCIAKYAAKSAPASNYRKSDDWDANWIIYRRTDVLLMKAEAMVTRENAVEADLVEAFNIVKAINTRSRVDTLNVTNPLKIENYMTRDASMDLVRKERLLELSYEGKRWYDLVRLALREKSTDKIKFVADKLGGTSAVVKTKMSTIDGLFMPIHIDELRYNKNLKQNPAYEKKSSSTEMN
ncbi:MAG: RagB/SusD family nutrient uptake outer membrane protein [Bacteroidaceae bacterium]|nr:RagB/SusD family nutrient uptake outer membrane protein [Bacteroidaceae bacterium]